MSIRRLLTTALLVLTFTNAAFGQDKEYHGDGIDDAMRFVPLASAFVLKAAGIDGTSSWERLVINSAASVAISSGVTWGLKNCVDRRRPDGTDNTSFPSGHTTVAFAGATVLCKEYWHSHKWICVAGYGVAALTAADRVRRNRHHWDDVAAGAAIGIGGTMLGYFLGDLITGNRAKYDVAIGLEGMTVRVGL